VRQPALSGIGGVDLGVAVTAATSDGEVSAGPARLSDHQRGELTRKRQPHGSDGLLGDQLGTTRHAT